MSDPVDLVYVNGSPVDKGAVRAYEESRGILVLVNSSEIQTMTLPGRLVVALGKSFYAYDATDTSSSHDGTIVLVSADGRRFRRIVTLANASSVEVADALTSAGVPISAVDFTGASMILGSDGAGSPVELTISALAARIDAALGSDDWRYGPGSVSLSSRVDHLPANAWTGMIGADGRLVQMGDGTLRVCGGGARLFNGDPAGNNYGSTRLLGVPPTVTVQPGKIYQGASAGFFIDADGWPWAWGRNNYGTLGDGSTTDYPRPRRIEWFVTNGFKVGSIVPVTSSDDQDCTGVYFLEAAGTTGRIAYLGSHAYGAAGDGSAASGNKTTPVFVGGGAPLTGITYVHACGAPTTAVARKNDGSWYGWGQNDNSCLGVAGTAFTSPQSLPAMNGWVKALVGGYNIIALTAIGGGARTCGRNSEGQLGIGSSSVVTGWQTPTGLATGVVDIGVVDGTAPTLFAITEATPGNRRLLTWGYNANGQCGLGDTTPIKSSPAEPAGVFQGGVVSVLPAGTYVGSNYVALFVRTATRVFGAGYNGLNNLSIGISGNVSTFTEVVGHRGNILDWASVGYSNAFGLIVRTDLGCWSGGYHVTGAAGIGPTLANEAVLQPLWVPGIMGPKGADGNAVATVATVSTLGSAASAGESALRYVSDESGGATLAFSDGTNWRRVQDRAIVS